MSRAPLPRPAVGSYPVTRWPVEGAATGDAVAVEEPLEIRIDGKALAVTMRTPGHDLELAAGFCLTEGVVTDSDDIAGVAVCSDADADNVVDVRLDVRDRDAAVERARRASFLSSSCGICGVQSLDRVEQATHRFEIDRPRLAAPLISELPARMLGEQSVFARTGGLHAAALFTPDGKWIVLREDVGRHNAVDKVIGHCLLQRLQAFREASVLLVSGRASFEIVQKAAVARVPAVAAVGAPTSLAVDLARRLEMTLIGFVRDGRFNVYSGERRLFDAIVAGGTAP